METIEASGPNAGQIEFWNSAGGENFVRHQNGLDAMLDTFGKRAMEKGDLKVGDAVLDIGCGCGDTSIEMARRVGSTGEPATSSAFRRLPLISCVYSPGSGGCASQAAKSQQPTNRVPGRSQRS